MGTYKYSAEFRADAVALARSSGRPVSRVAAELGVNHETLRQWIKTAEKAERPEAVVASAKDAEIAALRKQVRELGMERCLAGISRCEVISGGTDVGSRSSSGWSARRLTQQRDTRNFLRRVVQSNTAPQPAAAAARPARRGGYA
ncbi:transposase [Streptomyces sp. NPDC054794]